MRDHKPGGKVFRTLLLTMMIGLAAVQSAQAQEKLVVSYPASAGTHGPLWAAKDLGIFAKYGLSVDTVMIAGSARGIQALLANSTQIIQGDPASPILAASRGAEIAIIAQPLNTFPFTFLTQKEIRKPSDLIGKKIGILNFGGATEVAVTAALREWNVPVQSVTIVPMGDDGIRFTALLNGSIDATVLAPPESFVAARSGINVLAQMSDLKISFPHTVITARRSFIKQNPDIIKRYVQAYSEAIFLFKIDVSKGIAVYSKRLRQRDPKVIQQSYDYYAPRFSFPPKPDPIALRTVLDLVSQHAAEAREQVDVGHFIDDSALRALEKEGFFKKLAEGRVNK
jgi:ABC-type nitrate/sulfonate/bicarbonate transport system substrate-binding protein